MKAAGVMGVALFFVLAAGCSSSASRPPPPTGPLDCAWLASDNCMKATFTEGLSCTEPTSEVGVLSPDSTSCTYPSGVVVTFDAPLRLPLGLNPPGWHFSVARAGGECLRFDSADSGNNFKLVVDGNALTETGVPDISLAITCPDGTTYSNSTDAGLLSCDPGGLPSQGGSTTENIGTLWIKLFPTDVVLTLFNCVRGQ